MPRTSWVLCDESGLARTEFSNASAKRFSARRNSARTGMVWLEHTDPEAADLFDILTRGVPQIRYYRENSAGNMILRLSAYLTAIEEELSSDDADFLALTFKDPFGRILGDGSGDEPGRVLISSFSATNTDQGTIGWNLIAALNAVSPTGLIQGTIQTTTARDRSYDVGKNVGGAIEQLADVIGGMDFEILPLDPTLNSGALGSYNVYASAGLDSPSLIWGYQDGSLSNVQSVSRRWTPPVNRVVLNSSSAGLVSIQQDAASRTMFGEWAIGQASANDVSVQGTLDSQATASLRPGWVRTVTFHPDSTLGPQPFDDFWLGDTGRFHALSGAFRESLIPRVNGIVIHEDADNHEVYELEAVEQVV